MKQQILYRISPIVLGILGASTFISFSGTTVYITNKSPYTFIPSFAQAGPDTLANKHWNQNTSPIPANTIKHKLTEIDRDLGVTNHNLWEHLSTAEFPDEISFSQHIWKKPALKFGMEYKIKVPGIDGQLTSAEWYYWDNPIKFTWRDKAGKLIPFEIRGRSISAGSFKDLEYVISEPLNTNIVYSRPPQLGPGTLSILSLNTYLMTQESMKLMKFVTWFVPKLKGLEKPGVAIRAKLLPEAIGPDYDVLVLAEVWDSDARFTLLKGLKAQGYRYATCILGSGFMSNWQKIGAIRVFQRIDQALDMINKLREIPLEQPWIIDLNDPRFGTNKNYSIGGEGTFPSAVAIYLAAKGLGYIGNGGVIIVSKWPIKEVREWIFKEGTKADKYTKKGALYAKIDKQGRIYNVIGTHPSTSGAINIPAIAHFIEALKIPSDEPLFIAGDFNLDFFENKTASLTLKTAIPEWIGDKITVDSARNALKLHLTRSRTLDFIVYSNANLKPSRSFVQVRKMTSRMPWSDDKYPSAKKYPMRNVYDLSDHYGVMGIFTCY